MDSVRKLCKVNQIHNFRTLSSPVLHKSYTGKKVLVGIIDTDFDTHHRAFLDSLRKTRFIAVWDQVDTTSAAHNGYGYGNYKNRCCIEQRFGFRIGH